MPSERRMKSQDDVRLALAQIYRDLDADRLDVQKAKALCYIALSLSQVLSEHDLEARIAVLENAKPLRRSA